MKAHRIERKLTKNGTLILEDLLFQAVILVIAIATLREGFAYIPLALHSQ